MTSALDIALTYPHQEERGGAERFLNQLAAHLAGEGHAVTILCRTHGAPPHAAVRLEPVRVRALGGAWRMFAFDRAVARRLAERRFDLVVGLGRTTSQDVLRFGGACRETWAAVRRRFGERAGGARALRERVALSLERRAFAPDAYRRVLVNSRLVARDVSERYDVRPERLAVVPNGVDVERFHPRHREEARALRREWGLADGDVALLFLGLGFARKGLGPLLDALPELASARPAVKLVVAGDDPHRARWERRVAASPELALRVRFVGRRRDPERCLAAADLHVLPTYYDSFAYTVLEAFATGVPVVTTANAGAAELVRDGAHGAVLAPDFTSAELTAALIEWCDAERLRAAAAPVRARAEEHSLELSMQRVAAEILATP